MLPETVPVAKRVNATVFWLVVSYALPDADKVKLLAELGMAPVATMATAEATMTTQSNRAIAAFFFNPKSPTTLPRCFYDCINDCDCVVSTTLDVSTK